MSSVALRRLASARPTLAARRVPNTRFASSSTEAAQKTAQDAAGKAKEVAGDASAKAQAALGSAQKSAEKIFETVKKSLGPAGEKAVGALGAYREPVVYNLTVAKEVAKQVYLAEGLAPPTSISQIQTVYKSIYERVSTPSFWMETSRNGQWKVYGIYALEAYGIFSIGEILGRGSLVGYSF